MPRVKFDRVIRTADGAPNPAAAVSFYWRDRRDMPLSAYSAETGGSALTQPLTPDASGRVTAWLEAGVNPFWIYSVLVDHGNGLRYFFPFDPYPDHTDGWTALTLSGTWTNSAGTAGYMKTAEGLVVVRGLITGGAASSTIATLPAGYRPEQDCAFQTVSAAATTAVAITAATGVMTSQASTTDVSLDGIRFPVSS